MGRETFRKRDDETEGKDIPRGTGEPGDEQVNAIDRDDSHKPIGQDHSTERHSADTLRAQWKYHARAGATVLR